MSMQNQPETDPALSASGCLIGMEHEKVRLSNCRVKVEAGSRFTTINIAQEFINDSDRPQEVLYGMPLAGEVIEVGARIGDDEVVLKAFEKEKAVDIYEKARQDGFKPVMVEDEGEGLNILNLGRIEPGQSAEVRVHSCVPMKFEAGRWVLRIPTVIAPRYGAPSSIEHAQHTQSANLLAEHPLELEVVVSGPLRGTVVTSPSHRGLERVSDERYVLRTPAFKDRDVVLEFPGMHSDGIGVFAKNPYGKGYAFWVDLIDKYKDISASKGRDLHFLVDCSGSMMGDGTVIAQNLMYAMIKNLTDADTVSMSVFGSDFKNILRFEEGNAGIRKLRRAVARLNSDMGGTDIERALEGVVRIIGDAGTDILVLTDGHVQSRGLVERLERRGIRMFTVCIGAAAHHTFLENLSEKSDGYSMSLTANEDVSKVAEQLAGMTLGGVRKVERLEFEVQRPTWVSRMPRVIFAETPVQIVGGFASNADMPATIPVQAFVSGVDTPMLINLVRDDKFDVAVAKMMANHKLVEVSDRRKRVQIATKYGLLTEDVSLVAVIRQKNASGEATETTIVSPMVPAGFHGYGSTYDEVGQPRNMLHARMMPEDPVYQSVGDPHYDGSMSATQAFMRIEQQKYYTDTPLDTPSQVKIEDLLSEGELEKVIELIRNSGTFPSKSSLITMDDLDGIDDIYPKRCPASFLLSVATDAQADHHGAFLSVFFEGMYVYLLDEARQKYKNNDELESAKTRILASFVVAILLRLGYVLEDNDVKELCKNADSDLTRLLLGPMADITKSWTWRHRRDSRKAQVVTP